jgi:hypothetical protein
MKIVCHFCGREDRPIDPDATGTYAEVTGWSRRRDAGGSNQVSLREETGRYAHDYCVRLAVRGVDPANQGSLLDTPSGKA